MSVEDRGPKKGSSQESHCQVSSQENHLYFSQSWRKEAKEVLDEKDKDNSKTANDCIVKTGHQGGEMGEPQVHYNF